MLFLEADAVQISESLQNIFRETEKGECKRLRDLQQEVVARHREVEGFVRGFVGGDEYKLDPSVELRLDPDERGHPKTKEERDALLRVLSHFGISNYLGAGTELAEAKRLVKESRRLAEQRRKPGPKKTARLGRR